jgi:outer membrane protein assembly factor BamD (BamD/ComL family)
LHHYRAGRKVEALRLFERFIELEPEPKNTLYARQYVRDLRAEAVQ